MRSLSVDILLAACVGYVAVLFAVAFWADRRMRRPGGDWLTSPLVYTLSISVYCTSWTFYGAVGAAVRGGLEFVAIYTGPVLVFAGWWFLLRKLVRIGRSQRITSIADLLSSRYGKSPAIAVLVTLLAVVGCTPYIALQLKAVTDSFRVIAGPASEPGSAAAFWVAAGMGAFTILFGTRSVDVNERHFGVVAAIALEALVKLAALTAVGGFVVFGMYGGLGPTLADMTPELLRLDTVFDARWAVVTLLSGAAIICLPRQFQVTVVENDDERALATAAWLFPLYLLAMCLSVLPIAAAGLATLPPGANPDLYVLHLPLAEGQTALAIFVFLGGFSSATSMVIVSSIALSTMVSNHIITPLILRARAGQEAESGDVRRILLLGRRGSIMGILFLGFLYHEVAEGNSALSAIGLIAFAGVAQFLPPLVAGLYSRQATRLGALWGLGGGAAVWAWTLLLPAAGLPASVLADGPFGIALLRPYAFLGLEGLDPLVHSVFWSMTVNVDPAASWSPSGGNPRRWNGCNPRSSWTCSAPARPRPPASSAAPPPPRTCSSSPSASSAPAPPSACSGRRRRPRAATASPPPPTASSSGWSGSWPGPSAPPPPTPWSPRRRAGRPSPSPNSCASPTRRVRLMEYSAEVERKSAELEQAAAQLREANARLRELDAQKDDFLSQVSHELRTPMTSVRSFAEILLETGDLSSDEGKRFLSIIYEESLRLTRLLDQILDLNVLERGQVALPVTPVDAAEALRRAVETVRGAARHARFDIAAAPGPVRVLADPDRLAQVFINLLSNAVKYNGRPQPSVQVETRLEGADAVFAISDDGPGVAPADRERIFLKFSRGWDRTDSGGAGLGLAISREIMRRLGGDVTLADSAHGARFEVRIPLMEARAAAE